MLPVIIKNESQNRTRKRVGVAAAKGEESVVGLVGNEVAVEQMMAMVMMTTTMAMVHPMLYPRMSLVILREERKINEKRKSLLVNERKERIVNRNDPRKRDAKSIIAAAAVVVVAAAAATIAQVMVTTITRSTPNIKTPPKNRK
jgi:hypothetical protein